MQSRSLIGINRNLLVYKFTNFKPAGERYKNGSAMNEFKSPMTARAGQLNVKADVFECKSCETVQYMENCGLHSSYVFRRSQY